MNTHRAYRVLCALETPVIVGEYPVSLDGLLWDCLETHLHCAEKAKSELRRYLTFTESIAHASAMAFGTTPGTTLIAKSAAMIGAMRDDDLDEMLFSPNSARGDKYVRVQLEGGPTKNRLDQYQGIYAPFVVFDCMGDGDRIAQLLRYYLGGIGVRAKAGFGQIGAIRLEELDRDTSLLTQDKLPARPLPRELFESLGGATNYDSKEATVSVPYWDQSCRVDAVMPARIRQIYL